jgi:putative ABC transport system permease protein
MRRPLPGWRLLRTATLAVYLVIAVAVGVLAAIGPARRASKVNVLQAITAE